MCDIGRWATDIFLSNKEKPVASSSIQTTNSLHSKHIQHIPVYCALLILRNGSVYVSKQSNGEKSQPKCLEFNETNLSQEFLRQCTVYKHCAHTRQKSDFRICEHLRWLGAKILWHVWIYCPEPYNLFTLWQYQFNFKRQTLVQFEAQQTLNERAKWSNETTSRVNIAVKSLHWRHIRNLNEHTASFKGEIPSSVHFQKSKLSSQTEMIWRALSIIFTLSFKKNSK